MYPLLGPILGVIEAGLTLFNEKDRVEPARKFTDTRLAILNENLKPVDEQDHASLEKWYQELTILLDAIKTEILARSNQPK